MFYQEDLQIRILDVFHIHREKSKFRTPKRPFHILSKRISGVSDMTFEAASFSVTPKHLLYIPANTEYERQSDGDEEMIAIHFNILNKELFEPFLLETENEKCTDVFKEIHRVWSGKQTGYMYKCHALLYGYLSEILLKKSTSKEYERLEPSISFIRENLSEKLQAETLAKMCGLCLTQYRKLFKKEFGCSPIQYINKLRVQSAIGKMSGGYYSMAEIAEQCGFADQNYFNRIFKAETGKTPSQYKAEYL